MSDRRGRAVVVGSANIDLAFRVATMPRPGETVLAESMSRHPGGKGNNQAVAVARAGIPTTFIGAIGNDDAGDELIDTLRAEGVRTLVRRPSSRTGTAVVTVDAGAANTIVVDSGANAELVDLTGEELHEIQGAAVLLLQLEIPLAAVLAAARAAAAADTLVVLNAAPSQDLPDDLLDLVDVLIVNEVEATALGPDLADRVPALVVTLGERGARVWRRDRAGVDVPAPTVSAVDTTGAGDCFCGALTAALCEGRDLLDAARLATVAASLSVQREGAIPSLPTRAEITAHLPSERDLPILPAGDPTALDSAKIIGAPDDPRHWPAWRKSLAQWRDEARTRVAFDDRAYRDPSTSWASTCYSVAIVWLWDERLFDHSEQRFTPDRFLADGEQYGAFDAVVLWHAYPVIGIDDRDQFDFYRDVPGIRDLVAHLQAREVRVFIDYNPWDRAGEGDHVTNLVNTVTELGADGVFLDTLAEGHVDLLSSLRSLDPPSVIEGENSVPLERIADHQNSWAKWFADTQAPGIMRAHWFERRHMQHHTRRWHRDHSEELQSAWMNGTGMVVWDTVFGSWVGWSARDRSTLRAMVRAQRALSDVLIEGTWSPLTDAAAPALAQGVYVTRWQLGDVTLWTAVNRSGSDYTGPLLDEDAAGSVDRAAWFDVTGGGALSTGAASVVVAARGILGLVRVTGPVPRHLLELVSAASSDGRSTDATFPARAAERLSPPTSTRPPPPGAIRLEPSRRRLTITYRHRETGLYDGAPFVEEWRPLPPRLHTIRSLDVDITIGRVAVGRHEVTTAEFATFVDRTGYRPAGRRPGHRDGSSGATPATYVSLADARAYARWHGARLPTEFEWQVAAADPDFRRASPEVWNWTESEHSDGVTRFVMLKGGSAHRARGSEWYFDGGVRSPDFTAKLLLTGLGTDRSSSIGFRLAWDLAGEPDR